MKQKICWKIKVVNKNLYNNYLQEKTDTIDLQNQLVTDIVNAKFITAISFETGKEEESIKKELFKSYKYNLENSNLAESIYPKEQFDKIVDKVFEEETYKNIDFSENDYDEELKEQYDEIEKYALTRNEVKEVKEKPIKSKKEYIEKKEKEVKEVKKDREIDF